MTSVPAGDLDPALEAEIVAAVDAGFDAQIAFTRDLVRHPRCAAVSIRRRRWCTAR